MEVIFIKLNMKIKIRLIMLIKYDKIILILFALKERTLLMISKIKDTFLYQSNFLSSLLESDLANHIEDSCNILIKSLKMGNKILIAGNGGSAADAQHFAAELVGRFMKERKGLPAIALTTDTSILTSVANDYSYENVFSRQVEAIGKEGDVFIGFSTSGNSKSVLNAVIKAKETGMVTIGFLGKDGGKMLPVCDETVLIPNNVTARVQEVHEMVIHLMCEEIENRIFN